LSSVVVPENTCFVAGNAFPRNCDVTRGRGQGGIEQRVAGQ
jgi:hypothetical protein